MRMITRMAANCRKHAMVVIQDTLINLCVFLDFVIITNFSCQLVVYSS